jgi:predicted RNA-binding Zn-ribbon protein involved in translation (DUF1610 family)
MSTIRAASQHVARLGPATAHTSAPRCAVSEAQTRHAPIRLACVPGVLDEALLPEGMVQIAPGAAPDIVILTEPNAAALLTRRLGRGGAAIIPIVDATGGGAGTNDRRRADLAIERLSRTTLEEAAALLHPVVRRLRALPGETIDTTEPRQMLLSRLLVRDRAMTPRSDVNVPETFVYDDVAVIPGAAKFAEELAGLGLLERKFADKVTICPHCASARMTVRENCAQCGGADLVEEPIVHHFKCAYQGPERDFRRGRELVCPKCLQQLKNFSVDYDRPGSIGVCQSCGHLSTEHKVGFLCLDCGAQVGARHVNSRAIHSYRLTAAGRAVATGELPLPNAEDRSIGHRIRTFARRSAVRGEPCSILFTRLRRPPDMPESGDAWRQICGFFAKIMRECFTPETEIIEAAPVFLALLGRDRKDEVARHLPQIRERLERYLAHAPKLDLAVFSPDEIPGVADRPVQVV